MASQLRYCASMWVPDVEAIRYAMDRAGYKTIASLGAATGILPNTIWLVLRRKVKHPAASTMCAIAVALDCDVLDLMVNEREPSVEVVRDVREK
jgi:hypothetical protein